MAKRVNWRRKFGFPNEGKERQRGSFAMSIMSLTFRVGGLTMQRIVALDAPFLPALARLPALLPELLEVIRRAARAIR
jgi:hypothetical protein